MNEFDLLNELDYGSVEAKSSFQKNRQRIYKNLATFNRISSTSSGMNCHRSRRGRSSEVSLFRTHKSKGTRASWSHQLCGSAVCPVCSQTRARRQAYEAVVAGEKHIAEGGTALFLTLTSQTKYSKTPSFENAEYAFRRDSEALQAFKNSETAMSDIGYENRLADAVRKYAEENNYPIHTHKEWELNTRFEALSRVLSKSVFDGTGWKNDRELFGVKAYIRTIELVPTPKVLPDGQRSWNFVRHNLHAHIVLFVKGRLSEKQRNELVARITKRFRDGMARKGFKSGKNAQDARWVASKDISRVLNYIHKNAKELIVPSADPTHTSIWTALEDAGQGRFTDRGDRTIESMSARLWWRQMEQVFYQKKLMSRSVRFNEVMGITDELERRKQEFKKNSLCETLLSISAGVWTELASYSSELRYELLNLAENSSVEEVYEYLEKSGYVFRKRLTPTVGEPPADELIFDETPF